MNISHFRTIYRVLFALVVLSLTQPSFAQQKAVPTPPQASVPQAPVVSQPSALRCATTTLGISFRRLGAKSGSPQGKIDVRGGKWKVSKRCAVNGCSWWLPST